MGPIGFPEMAMIVILALLLFGPRKLPEIGRTIGKGMAEFRKASNELKRTLNAEMIQEEMRQGAETLREHDPRRMLRDVIKEEASQVQDELQADEEPVAPSVDPPAADPPAADPPAADSPAPDSPAADSPAEASQAEGPAGTIARSRRSSAPEPGPTEPEPTEPGPTEPEPTEPGPTEPTEPGPTESTPDMPPTSS